MRIRSKFIRPIFVFLLAIFAVSLWSALLSVSVVNADPTTPSSFSSSPLAAPPADDPDDPDDPEEPPVGEACGAGELLPSWVICLHGAVLQPNGQGFTPLDDVAITISYGGESVTTTTFVHPGDLTPTFSVDISPLEPVFLQPVTLTAMVNDITVEHIVTLVPDLKTRSQRVDIALVDNEASPPGFLWGVVMDYGEGEAVADAVVNAEYNGTTLTATTTLHPSQTQAIYTFRKSDFATIGATAGDLITLTAHYAGDADQQVVTVPSTATQLNFVTGWKCDDFDPLTDDVNGMGETGGGVSLPDVSCFWGYGLVDGVPTAGMSVYMEISGTTFRGQTTLYAGEEQPRYAIPVSGLDSEQVVTVTGVYSGFVTSKVLTVNDADSQRINLAIAKADGLTHLSDPNSVRALLWHDGILWAGTPSGVRGWLPNSSEPHILLTSADGLVNNNVRAIAVDGDNHLWFGTSNGVSRYNPNNGAWQTFTTADGLPDNNVSAIAVDDNNNVWFCTLSGVTRYDPSNGTWQRFPMPISIPDDPHLSGPDDLSELLAITVDNNQNIWFGTTGGVTRYDPNSETWQSFTTDQGLAMSLVWPIAIDGEQNIWFGTGHGGVSHYNPSSDTWQTFTTDDGLVNNNVLAIAVDGQENIWFGTADGVSRYNPNNPNSETWESFTMTDGLGGNQVWAIAFDDQQNVWLGRGNGLSRLGVATQQSDLSVQLEGPATALPNRPFTYTLQIRNQGQYTATNHRLALTLPVSATYVDANYPPTSIAPLISDSPDSTTSLIWNSSESISANSHPLLVVTATLDTDVEPNSNVTAVADITTKAPESFFWNNHASASTFVRDIRPDVRVNLIGPPVLKAGSEAVYQIQVDNGGGSDATNTKLNVVLPDGLAYHQANLPPISDSELSWNLGTLAASEQPAPTNIMLTVTVDNNVAQNTALAVSANITTTMPDSNPTNNQAVITVPTSFDDRQTLILVASNRFAVRYGAAPSRLYKLADHDKVRGVVVDVERDANVQAAYAAWDASDAADAGSWQEANGVATAIKTLIDEYTIKHPQLKYIVFVGGDDIIPFYRVADQNPTRWSESEYAEYVPDGTIRSALVKNKLLTDDFYADRDPIVPTSTLWYGGQPLYLPDFASGRLVETPDEINAVIDAFLTNDGLIQLGPAIVGIEDELTNDLGTNQCNALEPAHVGTNSCLQNPTHLRQKVLNENNSFGSIWAAIHSNHFSMGPLTANHIKQRTNPYSQTLLVSIGCHAGLNVPASANPSRRTTDFDLVQAFLSQGGTVIGTSAYGYASNESIGYSEALSKKLTDRLLSQTSTLGTALIDAKQQYFTTRPHDALDHLDEKVLLPVTLYGLPMLQVQVATPNQQPPGSIPPPPSTERGGLTVVPYVLSSPTYTSHELEDGVYYDFKGETIAQDGYPVQPWHEKPLENIDDQTPHGVILRRAVYSEEEDFDPLIAQALVMSEKTSPQTERAATMTGWDRKLPYTLGLFDGLPDTQAKASLNLVLGAYHNEEAIERLYRELTLEVLYSPLTDRVAPSINFATAYEEAGAIQLQVGAQDENQIVEVIGVCDDGVGNWSTVPLTPSESGDDLWEGTCQNAERFYVQVVDEAGNVAINEWQTPTTQSNSVSIDLLPGWNLVSIPVHPTDTNMTEVLASIAGNYELDYAYNNCDVEDPWKKYDPSAPPFANDLTDVDEKMGLWIQMTTTDTLEVSGTEPRSSSIPLCTGWNLVGYPSLQARPIEEALASIEGIYSKVYAYEATDTNDLWKSFDPNVPPFANDLELMEPRQGYWIKVNQDAKWLINN